MEKQEKNTELYGVENIKKTYRLAGNLTEGIVAISDGTNATELATVGRNLIFESMGNIPQVKMIPKEYADMSDAEQQEVKDDFAKHFDIPNDQKEEIFENVQECVNAMAKLGFSLLSIRKNKG